MIFEDNYSQNYQGRVNFAGRFGLTTLIARSQLPAPGFFIMAKQKSIFNSREIVLLTEIETHLSNAQYCNEMAAKSTAMARRFMRLLNKYRK